MSIRIVLSDDHRLLRAGLKTLLSTDPNLQVVGEATTGEEVLRVVEETHPDVVLMDLSMPGMDGLEATRRLIEKGSSARVLIMTMHEDSELMKECLRVGASGFIIKRAAESELVDAVYAVSRGIIYIHPSMMNSLVTPEAPKKTRTERVSDLSAREVDVLRLIVKGYSNREIASTLSISIRTVETHRANIMEKLNLHSRVDLVRFANEHGLV